MSCFSRFLAASALVAVAPLGTMIAGNAATAADSSPNAHAIAVKDSTIGSILADDKGMTLYVFTRDRNNVSNCEANCLVTWPAFMLKSGETLDTVAVDSDLRRSKLGVAMRFDGSRHVTYYGRPLYSFARDKAPGDVNGQLVGGVWFTINARGVANTAGR
jgi:predicted lipoprotein with Yx(FWY)xxD motif